LARPIGKLRLVALLIILVAALYVVSTSRFIRSLGGPGVHDVAEVLEGKVTEGSVSVRGIVDLVEPDENVLFLKDLKRQEVCIDSVCLFAVIKVHTRARFEEGEEAVVTGLIAQEDGFPVIISN
jgi:hypothetical protein